MIQIPLKSLAGRLDPTCRRTLEQALAQCHAQTNYEVEIEHWFLKMAEAPRSDVALILSHYQVDADRVRRSVLGVIERMRRGSGSLPALSQTLIDWATQAWLMASLHFEYPAIRSGHLLLALLSDEGLRREISGWSAQLERISVEALRREFEQIVSGSVEQSEVSLATSPAAGASSVAAVADGGALAQFTVDLTQAARDGKIDPVIGRDREIRQVIDILTRRRQNNPILAGEAGVGKTAVVEGFALRIAEGSVPKSLQNVVLRSLDLGSLQAGAGLRGEFESRIKGIIDEVKASPTPIILFIDEAHMLIGAGGAAGQGDAANLLKPALARGELRTIAATTWAEYKKYFEKDPALERRFQAVKVDEPGELVAIAMMRGLVERLERHFGVEVLEEAVRDAVRLSRRYITGRQLPDKAVSVLDTACARTALLQPAASPGPATAESGSVDGDADLLSVRPPAIEDCEQQIRVLETERARAAHEDEVDGGLAERIGEVDRQLAERRTQLAALAEQARRERSLIDRIRAIRRQLSTQQPRDGNGAIKLTEGERTELTVRRGELLSELRAVQGDSPLLRVLVDSQAVAEVISGWTGVPVGRMGGSEIDRIIGLRERLGERIIGQDHALGEIADRLRTARVGLGDPRRPTGVFLFIGTSGVGKTETALALADLVYGSEESMTVINMSEFKEEHKVSMLMGAPPGYVGYGEGGVLTEAVRRRPYGVILLDEMEKAHPGVQDVFYQAFDKGTMKDGEGRDINFRNALIVMTSNAASEEIHKLCEDRDVCPSPTALVEAVYPSLVKLFRPAFLGRCTIVPFYPLSPEAIRRIIEIQLSKIASRLHEQRRAVLTWSPRVVSSILERCTEVSTGARNVDHILSRRLLPPISIELLGALSDGRSVTTVEVDIDDRGGFACTVA